MIYSHLQIVQLILSAMDSDEVNSVSDTIESNQVSLLLKSVFYDIASDIGLPEHEGLVQLVASGDSSKPVMMTAPTNCVKIHNILYDKRDDGDTTPLYEEIKFKPFDLFVKDQQLVRNDTTNVGTVNVTSNGGTFPILYQSDRDPTYYTTFDDRTFIFDAYDSTVDTTLQSSKCMCNGVIFPEYLLEDDFTPDLNPTQFSYFINKAKTRAFAELKQANNQESASEARRQKIILQKKKYSSPEVAKVLYSAPRYGRK